MSQRPIVAQRRKDAKEEHQFASPPQIRYHSNMAIKASPPAHKIADTGETPERGHAVWKRSKIELGLKQAEDRASLIPADKVWRDLGLER